MSDEKRKGISPIPSNLQKYLNDDQQDKLRAIESFGWQLKFIRRPLFQQPIVIVTSQNGNSIGVLEEDGRLNLDTDIVIRD